MAKLRVLLVRPWLLGAEPIVAALRGAEFEPELEHVDFEAALHAAVTRGTFDLALYDPQTQGLSREVVESCLRTSPRKVPLVLLDGESDIAEHVQRALKASAS